MKNRISMALKDPALQQGFEIICKNLTELEKKAWKYSDKICGWDKTQMFDYLVDAYIAGYTDAQNTITQCNRMALKTDNTETFKNALNKIADLEQQNANLQTMLQAEREVRCNEEYLKKVTELEAQIENMRNCQNCCHCNSGITDEAGNSICDSCDDDMSMWEY